MPRGLPCDYHDDADTFEGVKGTDNINVSVVIQQKDFTLALGQVKTQYHW